FCITVTGPDGRAAAHACGQPARGDPARRRNPREPGKPDSTGPPPATGPPRITLVDRGQPGSHGTWRYQHGQRDLDFEFEDLTGPCDHRHESPGHDPGKLLKHLMGV
ncbi:MAG TPA: hypothetical protein VFB06_34525, partial [Streptosporangiaceae bacterium]|nr:hypothetical protein [Streptosporangiaceae bacterium]